LPWVIVCVALMLSIAYVKLRYSPVIFGVSGKLLVKKTTNPYSGGTDKFNDIFAMQQGGNSNLNDEIEIIKSRSMAARVVKQLGLETQYFNKGKIKDPYPIHNRELPFEFDLISLTDSSTSFGLDVLLVNDNSFTLNENPKTYLFGQEITMPYGKFRLIKKDDVLIKPGNVEFIIDHASTETVAAELSGTIKVAQASDFSSVLVVAYETENTKLGLDIVNQFMEEYQKTTLEDKRQIAENTLNFIEDQLKAVKVDLGTVENGLQRSRERLKAINPELQSQMFFGELTETEKELIAQGVKLRITDQLIGIVSDKKNPYRTTVSTLGIDDPAFVQEVMAFNKLQLERETALKTTTESNAIIKTMDASLDRLRQDMLTSLTHIRQSYEMVIEDLKRKNGEASTFISGIPAKEKEMLEVSRQQKILEELYSYLLQKKLETSISSASTISNIKVLEPAMPSGLISPNRKGLYTVFLLIGLAVPIGFIFLVEFLNDKVKTKADIERITNTPVLGEIGHAEESSALVVTQNNRGFIAEQFRIIRSNIQYILPKVDKPVMMVTSSFSGEGKSFISTNLGAVLAISGKKTVILEFDIRKPKIMEGLGLHERRGITNYIVSNISLNDIIYPVPGMDNLFVIPCGPVPPNPAEMLLDEKVKQLFELLKKQFDVVIIDTAPVGLVSDAVTLAQYANAAMYIVRHNYTYKKQVQLIDDLYTSHKLPNLAIIINDINSKGGYGGYYGYGNYGYGNYGYGNSYYDTKGKRSRGWLGRLQQLFSK
ncbi:MAG TPA: polysaccharide biosynthesis tyrosine autokinase, partial [Chitinophagaceae bacterium]